MGWRLTSDTEIVDYMRFYSSRNEKILWKNGMIFSPTEGHDEYPLVANKEYLASEQRKMNLSKTG